MRPIESMTSIKSTPYSFRRFLASVALFIQNTHLPFALSVYFALCLKLYSRSKKTRQTQEKQHPQRFKSTSRIQAQKQGTASAKDRSLFRVTSQRLILCARRNGDK